MNKILIRAITALSIVVLVAGSTSAVFSDSEEIEGNTLSTAQVDIDLRALSSGEIDKPLDVDGLVPGQWTDWARAEIYNTTPSTPVKLWFYVKDVEGLACSKINLNVTTGHAGGDERAHDVFDGPLFDALGVENKAEITGYIFDPTLPANTTAVIQQHAQLDEEADDSLQNTHCSWTEVFVAETPLEE